MKSKLPFNFLMSFATRNPEKKDKRLKNLLNTLAIVILLGANGVEGQISITSLPANYSNNFNSYNPTSAENVPSTINSSGSSSDGLLSSATGWTMSGSTTYKGRGTGSLNSGGIYGYYSGSGTDFSLGALPSGSFTPTYTLSFTNNSGSTITSLTMSWDYEQWRYGGSNTSGWDCTGTGELVANSTLNGKDFSGVAGSTAGVTGGLTTTISSFTISGLSILNGQSFGITWVATNLSGADNGVAIDNFSITASTSSTWDGTIWSNGAPTSTVDAIINGDYTVTTDISCKDLTINSTKTLTIRSGNSLTVAGNLVNDGTIVFKSGDSGTARFGQFSGTISGSGNVTVERYLPAKRAWRLLTAPLKDGSTSNTIGANWQGTANEGLLLFSPATYQTQTMTGYTTGGGSPNIWKYNSTSTQWQSIADISTEGLFSSTVNNGFLVFATGPSNSSNIASGSTDTTLKPVGQLITGSVNYALTANKYHLVGNPYASPLDTEAMVQAHANSKAYMVDPTISTVGGYVTFDGSNWSVLPSGSDKYIQSGQGFFLKSTTGGTFTIAETHKVSGNTNTWFQRTTTDTSADKIRVMLYKQSNSTWQLADGILAVNSASGNDEVDAVDTDKMSNFNENLWFKNGTSNLAIEYRGLPAAGTLQPLQLTGTSAQGYELRIKTENYSNSNLTPYLENTQTGALTAIPTDGSEVAVPFTGIASTSAAPDTRFRIVYQSALHLEDTNSLAVGVYPNPVNEGLFTVVVPQANTPASYTLTNLLGQEVQKGTLLTTNNSIQVQPLTPGVYLLQVNQEGKQFTTKIMIN